MIAQLHEAANDIELEIKQCLTLSLEELQNLTVADMQIRLEWIEVNQRYLNLLKRIIAEQEEIDKKANQ